MWKIFKRLDVFIALLLFVLIFRYWIDPNKINLGFDLSYAFHPLTAGLHLPYIWVNSLVGDGMGSYGINTLWAYPVQIFYQFLLKLNIPFHIQMKYFAVLPFIYVSYVGFDRLIRYFQINKYISWIIYVFNTYFILLLDGGQINIAMAYLTIPIAFGFFLKSLEGENLDILKYSLIVCLIGAFDIRVVVLFVFIATIYFVIFHLINKEKEKNKIVNFFKSFLAVSIFGILLNAYWILPFLMVNKSYIPSGHESVSNVINLSFAKMSNAISLFQPHWPSNVFGRTSYPHTYYYLISALVLFAIFIRRTPKIIAMGVVSLVAIFFVKGANQPFVLVYPWLFENVFIFEMFRDPSKFFIPLAFSYSVLVGSFAYCLREKYKTLFLIFFGIFTLIIMLPVLTGKLTGTFSKLYLEKEVEDVNGQMSNDDSFSRTMWLSEKHPYGYVSYLHPTVTSNNQFNKRPFAIGVIGKYETNNFIREAPFMGELFAVSGIKYIYYPYPDERRETLKQDNIDYYYNFLDQLTNLPWVEKRISEPPVAVLQTKKTKDHIFLAENSYFVVGSDRIYWDLMKLPEFDLSKNALVFAEERPGILNTIDPISKVVVYEKSETDLLMSFVGEDNYYFPASGLGREPADNVKEDSGQARMTDTNSRLAPPEAGRQNDGERLASRSLGEGWWKRETADLLWWRDFLQTKYGIDSLDFDYNGGYAIAEGDAIYHIPYTIYKEDDAIYDIPYTIFVRVMSSARGGRVEFWQGEEKIGEIDTLIEEPEKVEIKLTGYGDIPDQISEYDKAELGWQRVGKMIKDVSSIKYLVSSIKEGDMEGRGNQPLIIKTYGDINVINAIVTLTDDELGELQEKVEKLEDEGRIIKDVSSIMYPHFTNVSRGKQVSSIKEKDANDTNVSGNIQNTTYNIPSVAYARIDPTKYEIEITDLSEPAYLVFSETFDELWELNGQPAKPVYSLLNGFYVDKPGKYTLYFTPQKYVLPGLVVSGVTLVMVLGILIYLGTHPISKH